MCADFVPIPDAWTIYSRLSTGERVIVDR